MLVIAGKAGTEGASSLWQRIEDAGWFRNLHGRVLVGMSLSVERMGRQETVVCDLVAYLTRQPQVTQIELVALSPMLEEFHVDGATWRDLSTDLGIRVYSGLIGELVAVPDLLLEPFSLVTICEVRPDSGYGIRGPYLAQAGWLGPDDVQLHRLCAVKLAYEAHRLVGCDLCVAFGATEQPGAAAKGGFWLAGRCAAAVEAALGQAAGLTVTQLPQLNYLMQREQVDLNALQIEGDPPDLRSWRAMPLQATSKKLIRRTTRLTRRSRKDLGLARQNLYRVRRFLGKLLGAGAGQ